MDYHGLVFLVLCSTLFLQFNLCNANSLYYKNSTLSDDSVSHVNLDILLASLSITPKNSSFFSQTRESSQDPAYVLFQCRGDVTEDNCKKCQESAIKDINEDMHSNVIEYMVLYDQCWLYYSGYSGELNFRETTVFNTSIDPKWPSERLASFMKGLVPSAITSTDLYAKGVSNFGAYGFVQCVPIISISDCTECVEDAISEFSTCCGNHSDALVLHSKCIIRYDTKDFFDDGVSSSGNQKSASKTFVIWIVSFIAGMMLISTGDFLGIMSSFAS